MENTTKPAENLASQPMHAVYFLGADGRLLSQTRVAHNAAAVPPEYTPPVGDVFLAWSRDPACITESTYCVAITRAITPQEPAAKEAVAARCRAHVLDLRQPQSTLLPLGNWAAGTTLTRSDLECLHLRRLQALPPFRLQMSADTLLVLTAAGACAFDMAMRPLEMLALVPERELAHTSFCAMESLADEDSTLLRKEA
ncbi:MAG: hypothetical protein LBB50_06395 [Oscillospiraceae bacterium]|jgi:hypothetical protein|nr:hypothetical protein [Oscillospiraceae bacterium]